MKKRVSHRISNLRIEGRGFKKVKSGKKIPTRIYVRETGKTSNGKRYHRKVMYALKSKGIVKYDVAKRRVKKLR